uniref:Uncharacterized protein n=1 Tax=Sinocyclocheilus rhinocerous TaxID=307959 RepID=A0A673LA25_9TELE
MLTKSIQNRSFATKEINIMKLKLLKSMNQQFIQFQELNIQAPRAFSLVFIENREFLVGSSFKGQTRIYEHLVLDLSS